MKSSHDFALHYIECILLHYRNREYSKFSDCLKRFRFFNRMNNIRLPFLDTERELSESIKSIRSKCKFEIIVENRPPPYIILLYFQRIDTLHKCVDFVEPITREYIKKCIKNKQFLKLEEWV